MLLLWTVSIKATDMKHRASRLSAVTHSVRLQRTNWKQGPARLPHIELSATGTGQVQRDCFYACGRNSEPHSHLAHLKVPGMDGCITGLARLATEAGQTSRL